LPDDFSIYYTSAVRPDFPVIDSACGRGIMEKTPMNKRMIKTSRRGFLKNTAAAMATVSIVPGYILGLGGATPPNSKLNIAGIGIGGQGGADIEACSSENIVALCDVDSKYAAKRFAQFPNAKQHRDFRKMLEAMDKEIDAVVIGTPDHTHAAIAMWAMKRGKHVYCEKPLAHSIHEVRALVDASKKFKVASQLGNQGHSYDSIRALREWIEDGAIGAVREVHAMCKSVYGRPNRIEDVKKAFPIPETLDWDLWLGPAKERNYNPMYIPGSWRGWSAFGTGVIGDWTCHVVDPVFWSLDLGAPTHIEAVETEGYDPAKHFETFPTGSIINYYFGAKGNRPAVKLTWYDGSQRPPKPEELGNGKLPDIGALVVGDKGKIVYGSHGAGGLQIIPKDRMEGYSQQPKRLPKSPGHQREWINACKIGGQSNSPFSYGGPLTELALLGIIAMQFKGRKLDWDGPNMNFTNCPEANAYLKPSFRQGWIL
jgi:predicted dehydrogenase